MTWQESAACIGHHDLFDGDIGVDPRPAKRICASCPVTAECFAYWRSLPRDQAGWGIWVGATPKERTLWGWTQRRVCCDCGVVVGIRARRCRPCAAEAKRRRQADYDRYRRETNA